MSWIDVKSKVMCLRVSMMVRGRAAHPESKKTPLPAKNPRLTAGIRAKRDASNLERMMGVEPTYAAWEAAVLPMNYTRG